MLNNTVIPVIEFSDCTYEGLFDVLIRSRAVYQFTLIDGTTFPAIAVLDEGDRLVVQPVNEAELPISRTLDVQADAIVKIVYV